MEEIVTRIHNFLIQGGGDLNRCGRSDTREGTESNALTLLYAVVQGLKLSNSLYPRSI